MGADRRERRMQPGAAPEPRPSEPAVLRDGRPDDAPGVAALHAGEIRDGFLSFLGRGFLARLYRRIAIDGASFLVVAEDADGPVGFVAGTADVRGLYRGFLLHDGVLAAASAAPRLVRGWRRALETLRHGTAPRADAQAGCELLAIAVAPAARGRGIGGDLVAAFCDEVTRRGGVAAHVVVGATNRSAVRLYERSGFTVSKELELHAGTPSLLMRWAADGPAGAAG